MTPLRVGLGLVAAALFLLVLGPLRRLAQVRGWRIGRSTPVWFHRILCLALATRVRAIGEPSRAACRLIVSNHVGWLDIPVLGALEPMTFLAKKEIGGPFLGRQVALLQGVVFVDRERKRSIPLVNANMARAMRAGEPVVLFAEATTDDGNRLLTFRSSHFEAIRETGGAAVVQPVYMHFRGLAGMAVARIDRPIFAWYGDTTFIPHLFQFLRHGGLSCDVHYGDPIPIEAAINRKILARQTEQAVRALQTRARSVLSAPPETR